MKMDSLALVLSKTYILKLTFLVGLVASRAWSETHELASLKFSFTLVETFLLFTVLLCFISK